MSKEQKQLLLEIAKWHNKDFYNRMEDNWTTINYQIDTECYETIDKLEHEYINKYGDLPEWNYIDDVWATIQNLEKELGNNAL